ncbi:ferrous iron transport protein B [Solibacillus sp. R5-41]|uniref:ferrous iron transport protein B n=1 Tax=Solibacillus sp. R5-41 TaxID=2048654 RepID=UPI000C1277D9|nr:ferrous iron transport protein B [Solibacillus sp. R5-41]ATP39553.1 ferrous iron transport protein B [Solibacillus sp. R5-41]
MKDTNFQIALAGNPNTGKSTLFNALTGLNQHTGNWPGKTVEQAVGSFTYENQEFTLIDLPGTYSLYSNSTDEEVARDYIIFDKPDVTLVVIDATSITRNLNLALQVLEMTSNVLICLNLIDEAEKKDIKVDDKLLSKKLGVPVVKISARNKVGLDELRKTICQMVAGKIHTNAFTIPYSQEIEYKIAEIEPSVKLLVGDSYPSRWIALRLLDYDEVFLNTLTTKVEDYESLQQIADQAKANTSTNLRENLVASIYKQTHEIANKVMLTNNRSDFKTEKIDKILTSKLWGFPIMFVLLGVVLWLTIAGANVPSSMLANLFNAIEGQLTIWFNYMNAPEWLHGLLVLGLFRGTGWVVSVMLPPMAIFFPMFALLENYGYLPRVAFNMDRLFKSAGAHGKQSLTMAMGFGCNAAAIMSTRIIESPRERMLAILTNNFIPCNGRWPTLILLASLFMAANYTGIKATFFTAGILIGFVLFGVAVTLIVSWVLSKTALRGIPTHYTLELPPYRRPKYMNTILRSSIDKTWLVLYRAVVVAAPAAVLTWVLANINIGDTSILMHFVQFLDPFAQLLGLDGFILAAFIIGLPANEIVIPVLLMAYLATGSLTEVTEMSELKQILLDQGWTWLTALNMMLFSLLHYPCGTTLVNIYKETKSKKWTFVAFAIPTGIAIFVTFTIATITKFFGWV